MLGRRRFLVGAGAAVLTSRTAAAQPAKAMPRIGWMSTNREPDPFLDGFREGLRQHGYVEGQNVAFELRYGSVEELRAMVPEVRPKVALIAAEIGRASCRERGESAVVTGAVIGE